MEDTRIFDEAMHVVHEVFTLRDLEDEVKRVIQRGINPKRVRMTTTPMGQALFSVARFAPA